MQLSTNNIHSGNIKLKFVEEQGITLQSENKCSLFNNWLVVTIGATLIAGGIYKESILQNRSQAFFHSRGNGKQRWPTYKVDQNSIKWHCNQVESYSNMERYSRMQQEMSNQFKYRWKYGKYSVFTARVHNSWFATLSYDYNIYKSVII